MTEANLQDQLRSARESGDTQARELRHMMEGMKAHHEFEKKSLGEALQQVREAPQWFCVPFDNMIKKQTFEAFLMNVRLVIHDNLCFNNWHMVPHFNLLQAAFQFQMNHPRF